MMPIADAAQRSIYQQRTSCVSAPQFYRAYHTSSAASATGSSSVVGKGPSSGAQISCIICSNSAQSLSEKWSA